MPAVFLLSLRRGCLLLVALSSLSACAHHPHNPDAKKVGMSDGDYQKLTAKAHAGDSQSAETLARLWYQHSEDNTKALYWLDVAAQNGSRRAEKLSRIAKSQIGE